MYDRREFVCEVNMFSQIQTIFLLDPEKNISTKFGLCDLDSMDNILIELCTANNVNHIHLFCNSADFVMPVVQKINNYCVRHNAANTIKIEVN